MTADMLTRQDSFWPRLRALLNERGVDVRTSHLVQLHTEDTDNWLGIVVTSQRRVLLFVYDHASTPENAGVLKRWQDLTDRETDIEFRAFADQIRCGLSMTSEGRLPN